jgi:hypothetical protein
MTCGGGDGVGAAVTKTCSRPGLCWRNSSSAKYSSVIEVSYLGQLEAQRSDASKVVT